MIQKSKEYRNAGIMLLVFVLFLGTYFLVNHLAEKRIEETMEQEPLMKEIYSVEPDKISKLVLSQNGIDLVLEKQQNDFVLQNAPKVALNKDAISALLQEVSLLKVKRNLGKQEDWEQFGLKAPNTYLEIHKIGETKPVVVEIGDVAPLGRGRYVKLKDDSNLFLVENEEIENSFVTQESLIQQEDATSEEEIAEETVEQETVEQETVEQETVEQGTVEQEEALEQDEATE